MANWAMMNSDSVWLNYPGVMDDDILPIAHLVLKPEYSWTKSIPGLLLTWLFPSQDQQQPWHLICRRNESLFSTKKYFNYMCHSSFEKWYKLEYILMSLNRNALWQRLNVSFSWCLMTVTSINVWISWCDVWPFMLEGLCLLMKFLRKATAIRY